MAGDGQSTTVLVVDDNDGMRELLADVLADEGFDVATAENGQQALKLLRLAGGPCIVVTDLMMPVMDGWELISRLKEHPSWAQMPVIVVSAFGEKEPVEGAAATIAKPFDPDELVATVRQHCSEPPSYTWS
jgi:CheY-like chemotaxis protein